MPDSFEEHVKLMFDLQALALASDLTRVFAFKLGRDASNRVYPDSGVKTAFHSASHHQEREDRILDFAKINRYHVGMVPYFLDKLKKTQDGEAKNVLLGAFASHYDIKYSVVVDPDVDIHDPAEVEWAIATRFQADRDTIIISNSQGSKLDPSTNAGVGAKMGLDATIPLDAPEMKFKRIRVPGEENVNLAEIIVPGSDWRAALG